MNNRDDFSYAVKTALAKRVGYICSFPGCDALTVGPSDEDNGKSSSSGTACHIAAAAPGIGARRYDASMTSEQRKDISNGIWMCQTHGKLIDTDEERFTVSILNKWKVIAELKAQLMQEQGRKVDLGVLKSIPLAENNILLNGIGAENELIGDALHDSCLALLWGDDITHAVRDFIIEIARNSFVHGGGKEFKVRVEPQRIVLIDNGNSFNSLDLIKQPNRGGGAMSVEHLLTDFGDKLAIVSRRNNNENETVIAFVTASSNISSITPCYLEITQQQCYSRAINIEGFEDCRNLYLVLPKYMCISDAYELSFTLRGYVEKKQFVLVLPRTSKAVLDILQTQNPRCRVIVL